MDKIKVQSLRLYAYHGVTLEQKVVGQDFILEIKAYLPLDLPCVSDNVDDTVSYAKIIKTARRVFLAEKYDLLEKAAQTVADAILSEFPKIEKVKVEVKKPFAPIKADFDYVSVEITRSRK